MSRPVFVLLCILAFAACDSDSARPEAKPPEKERYLHFKKGDVQKFSYLSRKASREGLGNETTGTLTLTILDHTRDYELSTAVVLVNSHLLGTKRSWSGLRDTTITVESNVQQSIYLDYATNSISATPGFIIDNIAKQFGSRFKIYYPASLGGVMVYDTSYVRTEVTGIAFRLTLKMSAEKGLLEYKYSTSSKYGGERAEMKRLD